MCVEILKETACLLTLLVVDPNHDSKETLGKHLSLYFNNIVYAADAVEAINLYKQDVFDLVFTNIDDLDSNGKHLITEILNMEVSQQIVVCSARTDDPTLLLELIELGIAGFINRSEPWKNADKMLSKLAFKMHDKRMLMHYVEELEKLHHTTSVYEESVACYTQQNTNEQEIFSSSADIEEDDDFDFFMAPSTPSKPEADNSIYQDYFNFLDSDDREDLRDQIGEIDAALMNAFTDSGANPEPIARLGGSLVRYGNVLLHYQFFSDMGSILLEFGQDISHEPEIIVAQARDFELLLSGFCTGLQTFMTEVWEKPSDNPQFFNDSIINDAKLIMGMMHQEQSPNHVDDADELVFF